MISSIRQQARIPRVILLSDVVLQQLPIALVVASVVDGVDKVVVIVVMCAPAHGNVVTIFDRRRRRVKAYRRRNRRRISQGNVYALAGWFLHRQRGDARANLHVDILHYGSNILRQVIDRHVFDLGIRISRM